MKKTSFFILGLVILLVSCHHSTKKGTHKRILPSSTGNVNSLSVVINDSLWKGSIGEALRDKLASPVAGLPQGEPIFTLSHIPPKAFGGFTHTTRIFVKIEPHSHPFLSIVRDTFAQPQTGVFIGGKNDTTIVNLIDENKHKIIKALKQTEIKADQQRISKSLKNVGVLKKKFGISLKIPSIYRYAKKADKFVWMRKDIRHGGMEIMVFQVPLKTIDKDTNVVGNIVSIRDSIGKKYIPGRDKGTYMMTGKAYTPFLFTTTVDGHFTYLAKGNWTVKNEWMGGPFVTYAVRDEKHHRYLILDGMVFKPNAKKRDNVFELKSIFHSLNIEGK